jgi:hypothetical protein
MDFKKWRNHFRAFSLFSRSSSASTVLLLSIYVRPFFPKNQWLKSRKKLFVCFQLLGPCIVRHWASIFLTKSVSAYVVAHKGWNGVLWFPDRKTSAYSWLSTSTSLPRLLNSMTDGTFRNSPLIMNYSLIPFTAGFVLVSFLETLRLGKRAGFQKHG